MVSVRNFDVIGDLKEKIQLQRKHVEEDTINTT